MPAPTNGSIENFLTQALISQGLTKKSYDNNGNVVDTGALDEAMQNLVHALSIGLAQQWLEWQNSQVVQINSVSGVFPGVGVSGPGVGLLP